jgi:uncharacterized membrane protein YhaH (DUF805 family)
MTARQSVQAEAPVAYYKSVLTEKYADFSGRARRAEYWWFALLNAGVAIGLMVASLILGSVSSTLGLIGLIIYIVYILGTIVPSLAITFRRLHDTGKSAWFLLIWLIPLAGPIVIFVFTLLDGDSETNVYGESPKCPS